MAKKWNAKYHKKFLNCTFVCQADIEWTIVLLCSKTRLMLIELSLTKNQIVASEGGSEVFLMTNTNHIYTDMKLKYWL